MSMRVVHVVPTPFGASGLFGGGERYPLELARALAEEVACELLTFGRTSSVVDEPGGLRVRTLRAAWYLHGHPAHPVAPRVLAAVAGADVVHTYHMRSAPTGMAALAARARRRPTCVTDLGLLGSEWAGLLPKLFDRFLPISAYSARELRAPPARTRVIYGGADPRRFYPDPAATRHGVLFVGRLTPHKGIDVLIRALPPGAHLRIAGTGGHDPHLPERNYPTLLRQLAQGKSVEFLGAVPDDELPALYRQAQVLVLPSVHRTCYGRQIRVSELLGLVLIEAMASGTPVIASDLGGLPEVVQHGETGFLFEPGNVAELRARLENMLGNADLAARLGRNAHQFAQERFTWRATAERCLAAYAELRPLAATR